jgi:hypothetical protein
MLSGERVERRLAAVLAADIAGYSRLVRLAVGGSLSSRCPNANRQARSIKYQEYSSGAAPSVRC